MTQFLTLLFSFFALERRFSVHDARGYTSFARWTPEFRWLQQWWPRSSSWPQSAEQPSCAICAKCIRASFSTAPGLREVICWTATRREQSKDHRLEKCSMRIYKMWCYWVWHFEIFENPENLPGEKKQEFKYFSSNINSHPISTPDQSGFAALLEIL